MTKLPGDHDKVTTTAAEEAAIHAERARRFAMVLEGYEAEGPDCTVPGAARVERADDGAVLSHPRYALVEQRGDSGYYFANLAETPAAVAELAAEGIHDAYGSAAPVCYFDLDTLAGEAPRPGECDKVRLTDEGKLYGAAGAPTDVDFWVVGSETDTFDGVAFEKLYLSTKENADYLGGEYDHLVDEAYVTVIESDVPDERMPLRYAVAGIRTVVVFNTIPTEG